MQNKITKEYINSLSNDPIEILGRLFPDGMEVTKENLCKASENGINIQWLGNKIFGLKFHELIVQAERVFEQSKYSNMQNYMIRKNVLEKTLESKTSKWTLFMTPSRKRKYADEVKLAEAEYRQGCEIVNFQHNVAAHHLFNLRNTAWIDVFLNLWNEQTKSTSAPTKES